MNSWDQRCMREGVTFPFAGDARKGATRVCGSSALIVKDGRGRGPEQDRGDWKSDKKIAVAACGDDQGSADQEGKRRSQNDGDDDPDDQGMPLPLPKDMDQAEGMAVAEVQDLRLGERHGVAPEKQCAEADEGEKEQPLDR